MPDPVDNAAVEAAAERIAICQHPHGDGVWWTVHGADVTCIQDCECTPKVYVREAELAEARASLEAVTQNRNNLVEQVRELLARADESDKHASAFEALWKSAEKQARETDAAAIETLARAERAEADLSACREALEKIATRIPPSERDTEANWRWEVAREALNAERRPTD